MKKIYILSAMCLISGICVLFEQLKAIKKGIPVNARVKGYTSIEGGEYPMLHFTYNDEDFDMPAAVSQKKPKMQPGTELEAYYVKGSQWVYIKGEKNQMILGVFLIVLSIVIIALDFLT